ncbi:organic cation/carnitine transporter 2-like [Hypanus sabinus]|uniref:organic cation/carnitine transporter 2-like n=1 Tax=Hypanus sabinus TaxID=79690 RepID=UPI0028C3AAE1|nr:organic cation/carnitine transporter 2-like [Hypanus sabinus]
MRDYDEVTAFLGVWRTHQKLLFSLLSVSVIPNGFTGLSIIFVGDVPEHRCLIPENLNLSEAWRNRTIPLQGPEQRRSKCTRYRLDVILNLSQTFPDPDFLNVSEIEQEPCLDGWEYSKEQYISTIVSEWDLVCNNDWKEPFVTSVYFMGMLVGSISFGILSDRFGRKIVMFGTMVLQITFNVLITFSPNLEIFCLINFFKGFGEVSNFVAAFVLGSELLEQSIRITYSTLGVGTCFAVGYMILPFAAYFIREWKMLILTLSLSCLFYIPLWWFIPESPRWLLSKGRIKEAESIIRLMAKKNGVTPPAMLFSEDELEHIKNNKIKSVPVTQLLKTCNTRTITIINILIWMIITMGYYGLSLNIPNLHGNDYLNCFLFAASEIPANIAVWFLLQKFPRKFNLSSILFLSGSILLFRQLIPSDFLVLAVVLVLIGNFGNTCASCMVYVYTTELYPTSLRNTGVGVSSMASRIGSIVSPYIIFLDTYQENLSLNVIGVLTMFAAIAVLFLPETFKVPLPDNIEQMQKIYCMCLLFMSCELDAQPSMDGKCARSRLDSNRGPLASKPSADTITSVAG